MRVPFSVLAAIVTVALTPGSALADRVVLSSGHVDAVTPVLEHGGLMLRVGDETAGGPVRLRDPEDVVLHAKPQSRTTVPGGLPSSYAFLGTPGSDVWILPQVNDPALLWAGWSSEAIPAGTFKDEALRWRLNRVEGPGPVQLYEHGALGEPRVFFDSADGLPDTDRRAVGAHAHMNWVFHAPGMYTLNFDVTGERLDGTEASGYANYRVFVGEPADLPPDSVYVSGLEERYDVGAVATLRAEQSPGSRFTDVRWLRRCADEEAPREVSAGATYAFTVTRADDACRVWFSLRDDAGRELLRSDEALISVRSGRWGPRAIMSQGHADVLEVAYAAGALTVAVKDDSGEAPVIRRPQDVLLHAKPQSRFTLTADLPPEFGFLGKPGDTVYLLPEVQDPALLWPGWDTEGVAPGLFAGDELTWRLLSAEGPGAVQLFGSDAVGLPRVLFNTADGLPDRSSMPAGTHVHANWAFSRPGLYKLRFALSGTLAAGGPAVETGPVEYWFFAGHLADLPEYPTPEPEATPTATADPVVSPPAVSSPASTPVPRPSAPAPRPTLRLTSATLRGRTLTLATRLSVRSRVSVTVRRGPRLVARAKTRTVPASTRTLRVGLDRRLRPGRYRVQVTATAGGERQSRTITLRVRA